MLLLWRWLFFNEQHVRDVWRWRETGTATRQILQDINVKNNTLEKYFSYWMTNIIDSLEKSLAYTMLGITVIWSLLKMWAFFLCWFSMLMIFPLAENDRSIIVDTAQARMMKTTRRSELCNYVEFLPLLTLSLYRHS